MIFSSGGARSSTRCLSILLIFSSSSLRILGWVPQGRMAWPSFLLVVLVSRSSYDDVLKKKTKPTHTSCPLSAQLTHETRPLLATRLWWRYPLLEQYCSISRACQPIFRQYGSLSWKHHAIPGNPCVRQTFCSDGAGKQAGKPRRLYTIHVHTQ